MLKFILSDNDGFRFGLPICACLTKILSSKSLTLPRLISLENICAIDGIENEDPYELLIEKKSFNFDLNAIFGSNEE